VCLKSNPLPWGCGDGKSGRCLNTDQVLTWSYQDSGYTKCCAGSDKHKSFGLQLLQSSTGDSLNNLLLSCCPLMLPVRGRARQAGGWPGKPPFPTPTAALAVVRSSQRAQALRPGTAGSLGVAQQPFVDCETSADYTSSSVTSQSLAAPPGSSISRVTTCLSLASV